MAYVGQKDYNLEVLSGNVPGHAMVNIRGHDNTVPNGGPFGLSQGFGAGGYVFDHTNDNVAGTGALTVRISGLDASGNAQSNDVTMTGTTAANTASTFSAVFQVMVLTTGSSNFNTGVIYVGTGTFTAGIPAVRMLSMTISFNISLSAYYVVPTGKTLYARQFISTVGSSNKDVQIFIVTSSDGIQMYKQIEFGLEGGELTTDIIGLPGFVAGTHISLLASGGAAGTDVTAIVAGELIDN